MEKAYPAGSLAGLEQQIKIHRQNGLKTKAQKSEHQRLKSELNKLYGNNKKFIIEFEKTNYKYLALMRSTGGFYKLFDHSALFYALNIAPRLNLNAALRADGDFAHKSAVGFVSVRDPAKIAKALKTIDIIQLPTRDQTGNYLLFLLPWEFTEQQVAKMLDDHNYKLQKLNHVVLVDNAIPVLFLQLNELLKILYENVRGMGGPVEREALGYDMVKTAAAMAHLYLDLANGRVSKHYCLTGLKHQLNFIKYRTKILADLKIWNARTCARVAEVIIKVGDIIDREQKIQKHQ